MPKRPLPTAPAGLSPFARPKPKPKGFDPGNSKGPKPMHSAKLTMKKNLLPGKSGQR